MPSDLRNVKSDSEMRLHSFVLSVCERMNADETELSVFKRHQRDHQRLASPHVFFISEVSTSGEKRKLWCVGSVKPEWLGGGRGLTQKCRAELSIESLTLDDIHHQSVFLHCLSCTRVMRWLKVLFALL